MTNRLLLVLSSLIVLASACTASAEVPAAAPPEPTPTTQAPEPTALPAPTTEPTATPVPTAAPEPTAAPDPTSTPPPEPTPTPRPTLAPIADADHSGLAGGRGLTLQWISWEPEDWGRIEFVPLVDGSYAVTGRQDGPNGDFVEIDGTIVRISDRELRFNGTVTVLVDFNNYGEPCVRSGELTFLATGERRFWRMQDLLNCDDIVTDYVDIYFG